MLDSKAERRIQIKPNEMRIVSQTISHMQCYFFFFKGKQLTLAEAFELCIAIALRGKKGHVPGH